ncbi:TRAP transporter small permease [Paracoccus sp. SCSIO 75233]|uniref:TRAP transporter small permease n=1 Tax=Paracoccus sp. SCSIO 75233 TaxID=3017782 RepID=UPI0022F130ED|nr:TRAP transporter small permease [Paracoccus sp. SCSIO 75233]WBU52979.1 TRAP transporter small permease [Paracoccus sp. SCSIO 75233]
MLFAIGRVIGRVLDATQIIAAFLILAMMLHVSADVIMKYGFNMGFPATVEIVSNYYMVGLAFLPLAFAERMNAHITVEVVTSNLSQKVQDIAQIIAWLLSIIVYSLLTYRSFLDAQEKREIGAFLFSQGVRIDIWPSYYFLPVGFALMMLTLAYKLIVFFRPSDDGLSQTRRLEVGSS